MAASNSNTTSHTSIEPKGLGKHLFMGVISVLILLQIIHYYLNVPLFWDDLGVYGRSVLYLLDNGISIMPKDLRPELSRGHPMLFVFLTALFSKIFGGNLQAAKMFMWLIASGVLLGSYYLARNHFKNSIIAGLIGFYIAFQVPFWAQFGLILPEMMLALFFIGSFYGLTNHRSGWYMLFSSLAILTKETAIIIPFIAIFSDLWIHKKINWVKYPLYLTPILVFLIFLQVQKAQNGWYLFPYHAELVKFQLDYFLDNFFRALYYLFIAQGRFLWTIAFLGSLAYAILKKIPMKVTALQKIGLVTLALMLLFSCVNFYMNRYFMLLFPVIGFITAPMMIEIFKPPRKWIVGGIILMGIGSLFFVVNRDKFNYDVDLGYVYSTKVVKKGVNYLEQSENISTTDTIYCDFPINLAIKDPRYGYLEKSDTMPSTKNWNAGWKYAIITKPGSFEIDIKDSSEVKMIKSFKRHFAEVTIYRKR